MSWTKLPAVEGSVACLTCGCGAHDTLNMDSLLGVGFGDVTLSKNGEHVWSEMHSMQSGSDEILQAFDAEAMAAQEPDNDWRIFFFAPLYEAEYQRQGDNHWVLVKKGPGFA